MRKSKIDLPESSKTAARSNRTSSRSRDDTSKNRQKVAESRPSPAKKTDKNAISSSKGNSTPSRERQNANNNTERTSRPIVKRPQPSVSDTKNNLKLTSKNALHTTNSERNPKTKIQRSNPKPESLEKVQNPSTLSQNVKSNGSSRVTGGDKRLPMKAYRQGDSTVNLKVASKPSSKTVAGAPNLNAKQKHHDPQLSGDDGRIATEGKRLSRERTRTRTLTPEESKLMTSLQEAAQRLPQRPQDQETALQPKAEDGGDGYEDDFEDYESDFEDVTESQDNLESSSEDYSSSAKRKESFDYDDATSSSGSEMQPSEKQPKEIKQTKGSEENKMDSGHYDLAEHPRKHGIDKTFLHDIKSAVERENSALSNAGANPQLLYRVEPAEREMSFESVNYANFAQAKKRHQEKRASHKLKQRGEILLSMIRLDTIGFPLFEMAPVAYEVYMRSFGRSNTQQVYCQTNEDTISEEVQTDDVDQRHKWTQHPPALVQFKDISNPVKCAVASDPEDSSIADVLSTALKLNVISLEKFLLKAGQVVLNLLEEKSSGAQGLVRKNKFDLGFSQGFFTLGTESVPFLAGRRVTHIRFVPGQPNSIVTVHSRKAEVDLKDEFPAQSVNRCMLCVWSLLQPSQPLKILVSSGDVTACSLHISRPHFLFSGLSDGILSIWNLRERPLHDNKVTFQDKSWSLRSPSYSTIDRIDVNHNSPVKSIQVLDGATESLGIGVDQSPTQICSLDESGLALVWTVLSVSASPGGHAEDAGVAPGGRVRLVLNASFSIPQQAAAAMSASLGPNLLCVDMAVDTHDPAHMYVAVNTGHVVHCLSDGSRGHPSLFLPSWDGVAAATCLAPCPFGLPYFLVGCSDGSVRLHTRTSNRPLLTVGGSGDALGSGPEITCLQWSNKRPFVFFALDNLSRLHVWDLGMSDMYPVLTVPFKGKFITVAQLSNTSHSDKMSPFLALGTSCGKVKIHVIKAEFTAGSTKETAIELDKFKRYVTIL